MILIAPQIILMYNDTIMYGFVDNKRPSLTQDPSKIYRTLSHNFNQECSFFNKNELLVSSFYIIPMWENIFIDGPILHFLTSKNKASKLQDPLQ